MDIINSMIWLATGVIIGWFANRMITGQVVRQAETPMLSVDDLLISDKGTGRYVTPQPSFLPEIPEHESFKEQFFANDSLGG